jgi:hypothetical protein
LARDVASHGATARASDAVVRDVIFVQCFVINVCRFIVAPSENSPSEVAGKMTFHLRGNGGNLVGSEWIAAEGEIVPETATDLENFINNLGHSENPGGWSVRLNSPGGSLAGGIRLGELIRKLKLDTEVGSTEPDSYGHWERAPGRCASACAFAFLGGLSRYASGGELGVHQFYDDISLRDPSAKVFSSLDMSEHQFISAMLIDYAFRMGVDPRFVSVAASTPPLEMQFIDEQLLDDLNVRWYPKEFEPWSIEPSGAGIIAITRSRDGTRTATFSYFADGIPRLTIEDKHTDIDIKWLNGALAVIEKVVAFDQNFPKEALRAKCRDGMLTLEFTLRGIDGKVISASKWPGVGVDGPQYMCGPFTYVVPKRNAEIAIGIASKNSV